MIRINKLLNWLDKYSLELTAGFLLAFLPLYPKWPLFDALPGYIVRIRLEDFLILGAFVLFLVQLIRGKTKLNQNPLFKPIVIYLIIGLLSSISAIFLTQTVPLETVHVGKLALHWIRRVEYMSLALVFFAAVTSRRSVYRMLGVFAMTGILVSIYGFGQKYLGWPVYSTMNREFAKGWRLVLTEHARVSSTFAGHYDLAAYTIVLLMLFAASIFVLPKKFKPLGYLGFVVMLGVMMLSASATSFVAYVVAVTGLCILFFRKVPLVQIGLTWVLIMATSFIGLRTLGSMYDRFAHVLKLDVAEEYLVENVFKRFDFNFDRQPPTKDIAQVTSPTDRPPTPANTGGGGDGLPGDVFEQIPLSFPEASLSGIPATAGTGQEGVGRDYSDTAYRVGLSSAIRFDALWPRALAAFKTNPLLGSGYSTLVKENVTDFTEAESTDNDYLRALGETGLLGLVSFMAILTIALYKSFRFFLKTTKPLDMLLAATFIAGLVGLMVNALYIDVFVSSKVAYTLWPLMGLMFGLIHIESIQVKAATKTKKAKKKLHA